MPQAHFREVSMLTVGELSKSIQGTLLVIHSQSTSNYERSAAQGTLDQLIASEQSAALLIPACLELLQGGGDATSCHFALATISKYIRERSDFLSVAEWTGLKCGLLSLIQNSLKLPFFVMSKLVDVICDVAIRTWPKDWPELLPAALGIHSGWGLCIFARVCDSLSEESLSVKCIAPERQISLRIGLAEVADSLSCACVEFVRRSGGGISPQIQWVVELVNGLIIATKQSSHLIRHGLHEIVLNAFVSCPEPAVKMLCVECLSSAIQYLHGQSGRSYAIPRATKEQDLSLLNGIIKVSGELTDTSMIQIYCEQEDLRDPMKAFFDLLTDIRKTANIFSYFANLTPFADVLVQAALVHPSLCVQVIALTNIDALLRMKSIKGDRRVFLLCFLACHDYYTVTELQNAPVPSPALFPHMSSSLELERRRSLSTEEAEDEDMKVSELVGKLKNVALLCVRHITTIGGVSLSFIEFLKEILSESIKPSVGVTSSYYPALLFTEAVATALPAADSMRMQVSAIVDIVSETCPSTRQQDYLWFVGKAGALISEAILQGVFLTILAMDIVNNFPVQVAFIALCKSNPHSFKFAGDLHQALQNALGGESRSWAIGAILSASSHGGVGSADGYATSVYSESKTKLDAVAKATTDSVEEFAKRASPIFATLKAILEVPLSPTISAHISTELATSVIPFCWSRVVGNLGEFGIGPNEFLAVMGSQFVRDVPTGPSQQYNACFQMFLLLTQVTGICLSFVPMNCVTGTDALQSLFNPGWNLRPSLLNILISNVAASGGHTRPQIVLRSMLPQALTSLQKCIAMNSSDDFTIGGISRASVSVVQTMLNSLQIATDDEFSVSDFSGAPKPILTQKQLKAQLRSRNRFTMIAEDSPNVSQPLGPKIPYELLQEPEVALSIVGKCIEFRTDKALRRMSQSIPTILTRWWNSVSNNATLAAKFVQALPQHVLSPVINTLYAVRMRHPSTLPGGPLHSYAIERAVSGRRLASELVDHSTISIHGILSVLWRYAAAGRPGHTLDPIAVVSACPALSTAIQMILEAKGIPVSTEAVAEVVNCAREQSLESRASLKFTVQSIAMGISPTSEGLHVGVGVMGTIRATSKDLDVHSAASGNVDDSAPIGNLF